MKTFENPVFCFFKMRKAKVSFVFFFVLFLEHKEGKRDGVGESPTHSLYFVEDKTL